MAARWSDDLNLGIGIMDRDHRALFVLLERFPGADEAGRVALFNEIVAELTEHFEHENELMRRYDFFAYHCHHGEHERVLAELRALQDAAAKGDSSGAIDWVETKVEPWFMDHRNSMDLVTARFLAGCGYTD